MTRGVNAAMAAAKHAQMAEQSRRASHSPAGLVEASRGRCPGPDCDRWAMTDRVFCGSCWHDLDPTLKRRLAATAGRLQNQPGNPDRHADYQDARDQAIASLGGR